MTQKKPTRQALLEEIAAFREQIGALQRAKADLELLLETTVVHSDDIAADLYQEVETARQESEERYRLLFDHMLDGFAHYEVIFDKDGQAADYRFLGANAAFEKLTGLEREAVLGKTVSQVLAGRAGDLAWIGACGDVALTGEGLTFEQYLEAEDRWYAISAHSPRRGYFATILQDITRRKRNEAELATYREHLEELVAERTRELEEAQAGLLHKERLSALGQVMAVVSHEMRNPLNNIRVALFSIGEAVAQNEVERVERMLSLAERNVLRCDRIVGELLDYTRNHALYLELTGVEAWLDEVLDESQVISEDIVCAREWRAGGVKVLIDRERLRRAVLNVVENAVQALQDEGAQGNRLTVSTHVVKGRAGSRLEIRVEDTGPGIPAQALERIFEPFFSTRRFGVGLGLPIVKNIMEQHGGGVRVQSKAVGETRKTDQGTSVTLWLPISGGGEVA
jgi:PAS domain S-box-containing protein